MAAIEQDDPVSITKTIRQIERSTIDEIKRHFGEGLTNAKLVRHIKSFSLNTCALRRATGISCIFTQWLAIVVPCLRGYDHCID